MSSSIHTVKPNVPNHVAIVMDGNGRWSKLQGKPRFEGHRKGAEVALQVVHWAKDLNIRNVSLYTFSIENWNRPKFEVITLMNLLTFNLLKSIPEMKKEGVRFRVIGDIAGLPKKVRNAIEKACAETESGSTINLFLCINYGGQQEIVAGVQQVAKWMKTQDNVEKALAELTPELFRSMLWRGDVDPVDLLIRSGGEQRISNFHLWDAAYAELYFSDVFWPDFTKSDLQLALDDFANREYQHGKSREHVNSE